MTHSHPTNDIRGSSEADPLHATDDTPRAPRPIVELVVLLGVALLLAVDLAADARSDESTSHVVLELVAVAVSLGTFVLLFARWRRNRRDLEARLTDLTYRLGSSRDDAKRWQAEAEAALSGLGAAIELQFQRWKLTEAEQGVGLLLLKGLSLKEVAAVRGTSERTVRQQALAVYRKADLAGRAELSAFFLEDLLLPSSSAGRERQGKTDPVAKNPPESA